MRYTPRTRDRYKNLVALLTGAATFGTVAATGAVTGIAAHHSALRDRAREEADAFRTASARAAAVRARQRIPWSPLVTVVKTRPHRTVVRTVVVHRVSRPGVASVGAGAAGPHPVGQHPGVPPADHRVPGGPTSAGPRPGARPRAGPEQRVQAVTDPPGARRGPRSAPTSTSPPATPPTCPAPGGPPRTSWPRSTAPAAGSAPTPTSSAPTAAPDAGPRSTPCWSRRCRWPSRRPP